MVCDSEYLKIVTVTEYYQWSPVDVDFYIQLSIASDILCILMCCYGMWSYFKFTFCKWVSNECSLLTSEDDKRYQRQRDNTKPFEFFVANVSDIGENHGPKLFVVDSYQIIGFFNKIVKPERMMATEYKSHKYNFVWLILEHNGTCLWCSSLNAHTEFMIIEPLCTKWEYLS